VLLKHLQKILIWGIKDTLRHIILLEESDLFLIIYEMFIGSRNQSCSETWWCVCGNNLCFIWDLRFRYREAITSGNSLSSTSHCKGRTKRMKISFSAAYFTY
jgi:hypothetical protein